MPNHPPLRNLSGLSGHPPPPQSNGRSARRKRASSAAIAGPILAMILGSTLPGVMPSSSAALSHADKGLAPVAGYAFQSTVDLSSNGTSPARTVIRGIASLARVNPQTNRIQFNSVEVLQTDGNETQIVALSPAHRAALAESFEVVDGEVPSIVVGVSEPEEITNIKRTVGRELGLSADAHMAASANGDAFGEFKGSATIEETDSGLSITRERSNEDYTRLSISAALDPQILVSGNETFDTSGVLNSASSVEEVSIDYGSLPSDPRDPTATGASITQKAAARLSIIRQGSGTRVASLFGPTRQNSLETAATTEIKSSAQRASAPTVAEALQVVEADPTSPSAAMTLAAAVSATPQGLVEVQLALANGTISNVEIPAVAGALAEVGTDSAQTVFLHDVMTHPDLTDIDRQNLAITAGAFTNPLPELATALAESTEKGLSIGESRQRIERPDCDILDEPCPPTGGGNGGPPVTPRFSLPYVNDWTRQIGNNSLGTEFGAGVSLTSAPGPYGTNEYNAEARAHADGLILNNRLPIARAKLSTTVDQTAGTRNLSANLRVLGANVYQFSTDIDCQVERSGNLYQGTLPIFNVSFFVPVGPVIFYGGASAAGHLGVPWHVRGRMCGPEGFVEASIDPQVYVQVRGYAGVSIIVASAGLEAIGTIAHTTISPNAQLVWKPLIETTPAARFRIQLQFQAFSLRVHAWLRILFWTRRWTLVTWSTPVHTWTLYSAETANWARLTTPPANAIAVGGAGKG